MNSKNGTKPQADQRHVGFLFNHDQIHQIAHSLPVAVALAAASPKLRISIATTNDHIDAEVCRLLGADPDSGIERVRLGIRSLGSRLAKKVVGRLLPAGKFLMYRDNLDYFNSLDALVVTERTSLILKMRYGLNGLKIILVDHGAGDRAIGFGSSTAAFDNILAAGPKIRDRLIAEAGVEPDKITIAGYPKFDAIRPISAKLPVESNDHPTVLYNPHLSPHLSSWFKHGRDILDWFVAHPDYNLIFAPHIMMFQRRVVFTIDKFRAAFPGSIDMKYWDAPNIHIDLGSPASTDMTYTNAADIYLGDVSSQIYEFLRNPRPAIFLNSHGYRHKDDPNFAHWAAGEVINSVAEIGAALAHVEALHGSIYKAKQKELFDYTFDLTDEPSSLRAARAIDGIVTYA